MDSISKFRQKASDILNGFTNQKVVICGPCSIHDKDACIEYAKELKKVSLSYQDQLFIIMRVFLEKPRTKNNWRGFLNDPDLDNSLKLEKGIQESQALLKELSVLKIPLATEFIDPCLAFLTQGFITWGFIGARTVRSPTHRQLASFLKMPIGFKNPLDGDLETVYSAIHVANSFHTALLPDDKNNLSIQSTPGNNLCHGVLRGSNIGPNFQKAKNFIGPCLIDCAHGNANKTVHGMKSCFDEAIILSLKHSHIKGVMLESFIHAGSQKITNNLAYGVSITDPCLSLYETTEMIDRYYKLLSQSQGSSSNLIESCLISGSSSAI